MNPYPIDYEFSSSKKDKMKFRVLKHIKKLKARRRYLRRHKEN